MKAKFLATASLLLVAIGVASLGAGGNRVANAKQNGPASVGRYQVSASGKGEGEAAGCFMVDTTTGELWQTGATEKGSGLRKWNHISGPVPASK